jgi:hypothetical protein
MTGVDLSSAIAIRHEKQKKGVKSAVEKGVKSAVDFLFLLS